MGTEVTVSSDPICLETSARASLASAIAPWLASSSLLTLVLLTGKSVFPDADSASGDLRVVLDEVEQLAVACIRRTDVVVRSAEYCCALVLLGAELSGALCVVNRLRRRLEGCDTLGYSLLVGLAAAPEQATDIDTLITLACQPSVCLVPSHEGYHAPLDVVGSMELPDVLTLPRSGDGFSRSDGMIRQREVGGQPDRRPAPLANRRWPSARPQDSHQTATFVQARARALGIPYLAPPQRIPNNLRNLLPQRVMQQLQCFPVGRDRNSLTVALVDPADRGVLHQLEQITGLRIFPVMTDPAIFKTLARPAHVRRSQHETPARAGRRDRNA